MGKDWSLVIVFLLLGRHEAELRVTPPAVPRAALELRYDQHRVSRALAHVPRHAITLTVDARAARLLAWLGLPTGTRVAQPQAGQTPFALSSSAAPASGQPEGALRQREPAPDDQPAPNATDTAPPNPSSGPTLDVVRVAPDGPSIFAGTAPPGSDVTVLDGGRVIGTAKAGPEGDWSLVTEQKVTGARGDITVTLAPPALAPAQPEKSAAAVTADASVPAQPEASRDKPSPAEELVLELEKKVEEARSEAESRSQTAGVQPSAEPASPLPAPAPGEPAAGPSAEKRERPARQDQEPEAQRAAATADDNRTQETIPVPIQFEYRSSALTPEGRRAAGLLLEYLKLKSLASITLSGHADERGGNRYNMELSRDRLAVIRRLLRDGGFDGRITLLPRGEREPYQGVDRTRLPVEDLMQLDRRVELRTSH